MTSYSTDALAIAFSAVVDECRLSAVGNLLENHLKVVIVDRLLRAGHSVMEGTSRAGKGKVLRLDGSRMDVQYVSRPSKSTSPDIRIVAPEPLVLELQARSLYGTQDTLFSAYIVDDLERVRDGRADAFILAADRDIYDPIRGVKANNLGRRALAPDVLAASLPPSQSCECGESVECRVPSGEFACSIARVASPYGTERIILSVSRAI